MLDPDEKDRLEEESARNYLSANEEKLVRLLKGSELPKEQPITIVESNQKRERFGNPYSRFWRCEKAFRRGDSDSTSPPEKVRFYFEYFNGDRTDEEFEAKYAILDELSGSGFTPKAFKAPELPRALILSLIGDKMLETEAEGKLAEERARLYLAANELLLKLHVYAQGVLSQFIAQENNVVLNTLRKRVNRPAIEKIAESYLAFKGYKLEDTIPTEVNRELADFFRFVDPIAQFYEANKKTLIFGDAGSQNFVGPANKQDWQTSDLGVVDLEGLTFGHPMFASAKLATSHNMDLGIRDWNAGIASYLEKEGSMTFERPKEKIFWVKIGEKQLTPKPEVVKDFNTAFYAACIRESLQRIGYMHNLKLKSSSKYKMWLQERPVLAKTDRDMGRNIRQALDYVLSTRDSFTFSPEQFSRLENLRTFFANQGLIPGNNGSYLTILNGSQQGDTTELLIGNSVARQQ